MLMKMLDNEVEVDFDINEMDGIQIARRKEDEMDEDWKIISLIFFINNSSFKLINIVEN